MSPARPSRLLAGALALGVLGAAAPGCSWVHQRQAVEANRPARLVDRFRSSRKVVADPPPRVILRVDPTPPHDAELGDPR